MFNNGQARKRSPSDLPDEPWVSVGPMIPHAKRRTRGGRPRAVALRAILNTIPSLNPIFPSTPIFVNVELNNHCNVVREDGVMVVEGAQ